MALPTFLGIGVPRAGTTWLHELLGSHPEIYVPVRRKELSFFDLHYERGVSWYEKFFPPEQEADRYRALGEVTPYYYDCPDCPERIARLGIGKLVLMLRHPVDRAWSYYGQKIRNGMFRGSFEDFLTQSKWPVVEQGHYSGYLRNYLRHFDRDQILVLLFERALSELPATKHSLATFLGVSEAGFAGMTAGEAVNPSYVPRSQWLYGLAFRISKVCRHYDLDWVVNAAKNLGLRQALGTSGKVVPMRAETRIRLDALFQPEIGRLEKLLDISLDVWRQAAEGSARDEARTPAPPGTGQERLPGGTSPSAAR
jgi:hypothetical protein